MNRNGTCLRLLGMKHKNLITVVLLAAGAMTGSAQTLTQTYVALADSADRYIKLERWNDAERVIVSALRHEPANPSNWLLWSNLGVVRTHLNNYPGAVEAYDVGLAGAPKSTVLLSNRAWTQLSFGHTDKALDDMNASLSLDSLQPWPLKMRGLLNIAKHPAQARRDLMLADSLSPSDPAVIEGLADLEAADGKLENAVKLYDSSLKLRPDPDVSFKMFLIMTEHGNFTQAADRTINALAKWPTCAELHIVRALQHQQTYQTKAALKEKNLAIAYGADPRLVDAILSKNPTNKNLKVIDR